jgi:hypothetical protein
MNGDQPPTIVSLAEGVQNLQFEYAFDTVDNDGTVQMSTAPMSPREPGRIRCGPTWWPSACMY